MSALERSWAKQRNRHEDQVQGWRYFPSRGVRRAATVRPTSLRYWSFAPPRPWILALGVVVIVGYLGYRLGLDDNPPDAGTVLRFLAIVALVLLLSITRTTVSQHGLSFDVAGIRRVSCYGFVPLGAVDGVSVGARPADWPRGRAVTSWFPGARPVHVAYREDDRRAVKSLWVRDPDRFGEAVLGHPLHDLSD